MKAKLPERNWPESAYRDWLRADLAQRLKLAREGLDSRERFSRLGLTSILATRMMADLGKATGRVLPPTLVWECPTITALARRLAGGEPEPEIRQNRAEPVLSRETNEPLAIVGLACRFPAAPSPAKFWQRLCEAHFAVGPIPPERWNSAAYFHPDPQRPGKMNTRWGGFLNNVDLFDPLFFGISPREAEHMDPQQRLALTLAWEALEDAGLPPEQLKHRPIGVFMGAIWHDYADLLNLDPDGINLHSGTGVANNLIANRISYTFGFTGPSLVVDTACSSSLVSLHLACQSIRSGESELALAGGANLILNPVNMISLAKFGGVSTHDRCRAFDAKADGFVRGEGAGIMVLKPLSQARASGDRIYCLMRGSATNNDGASNGLTAPNPQAQISVLRQAYVRAKVTPTEVGYVEAHGAGTALGDPIEAGALHAVLGGENRPVDRPLLIGSVKTNIGHLEGAAGVAGAIKTALCLYHGKIPPSLHFETPNPDIPFSDYRMEVVRRLHPWPQGSTSRLAGISSFGWGGTNCHVVLEGPAKNPFSLLALQASSRRELKERTRHWDPTAPLPAAPTEWESCELTEGPIHRMAFVGQPGQQKRGLAAFLDDKNLAGLFSTHSAQEREWVFVFSPQGGFYRGMGQDLLRSEPAFRNKVQQFDRAFRRWSDFSPLAELAASSSFPEWRGVDRIQPLTVAMQLGLAALFLGKGIVPTAVIGHSLGEISAAHVAGILSLEDTAQTIAIYSKLQARTDPKGGMAIIGLTEQVLRARLDTMDEAITPAALNGPETMVVSGDSRSLDRLVTSLTKEGIFARRVKVEVGAHSSKMDPILEDLTRQLAGIRPQRAILPMISTLTGSWVSGEELDGSYWSANLRRPVQFAHAAAKLAKNSRTAFLELNPHPILAPGLVKIQSADHSSRPVVCPLRQGETEQLALGEAMARMFCLDSGIHLPTLQHSEPSRPLSVRSGACNTARTHGILPLSAHNRETLAARVESLHDTLTANPEMTPREVGAFLARRRGHHDLRIAFNAKDQDALRAALKAYLQGERGRAWVTGKTRDDRCPKLVFLFPGQGSQWQGMGRQLFECEPVFAESMKRMARLMKGEWDHDLIHLLWDQDGDAHEDVARIQPLLFAIQVSLAQLWRSWGVKPAVVLGHSMGETAAACVAGALTLEEAIAVICRRSRLMAKTSGGGAMLAVELDETQAETWAAESKGEISVAVSNSPRSTVLTGSRSKLDTLRTELEGRDIFCRWVKVNLAAHGPQMDPILDELRSELASIKGGRPARIYYSSVLGQEQGEPIFGADYWVANLRKPVRFAACVSQLLEDGYETFLEISPHPILLPAVEQSAISSGKQVRLLESLHRDEPDCQNLNFSLGRLYCLGYPVDWAGVYDREGCWLDLPAYPWQESRYWAPSRLTPLETDAGAGPSHPFLGQLHQSALRPQSVFWQRGLNAADIFYLEDHRIRGAVVVSAAVFVAMAMAARQERAPGLPLLMQHLRFDLALVLEKYRRLTLQTALEPGEQTGEVEFAVSSYGSGEKTGSWLNHAAGQMVSREIRLFEVEKPDSVQSRCSRHLDTVTFYGETLARGVAYGEHFQAVREVWVGRNEALGKIDWPASIQDKEGHALHPVLLDACLQILLACLEKPAPEGDQDTFVTVGMDRLWVATSLSGPLWSHARIIPADGDDTLVLASVSVFSMALEPLVQIQDIRLKRLDNTPISCKPEATRAPSDLLEILMAERDDALRRTLLLDFVAKQAASVLKIKESALDVNQPLQALGLNSLMTLELRNRLEGPLRLTLSATLVWNYPTISKMTAYLAGQIPTAPNAPGLDSPQPIPAPTHFGEKPEGSEVEKALLLELEELEALLES